MQKLSLILLTLLINNSAQAQNDPSLSKIMEAMQKAGAPGSMHRKLNPLVGEWSYTAKLWAVPGQPPITFKGKAKHTFILGGRYIQQDVESSLPMPFKGFGLIGYDNLKKKYTAMWVDSMTTTIFTSKGSLDKGGKVFTFHGVESDPLTKKTIKTRDVIEIKDKDTHTMTAYRIKPGQKKETKVMEIVYKRKK